MKCESCKAVEVDGEQDGEDGDYCHGCGKRICLTCSCVFGHFGNGPHSLGDPQVEVDRIRAELMARREADRWIPVTYRLPEERSKVLILKQFDTGPAMIDTAFLCWRGGVGGWDHDNWHRPIGLSTGIITHWLPLPEPPKEANP